MVRRRNLLSEDELKLIKNEVIINDEQAYQKFFENCIIKNLRKATIQYYENEFSATRTLLKVLKMDKQLTQLNAQDVKQLIVGMKNKNLKISSINTRLRALRSFYNFLYSERLIDTNPLAKISLLKDRRTVIETFTNEQITSLFSAADQKTWIGVRDKTIMALLLDTGLRISELVAINLDDIKKNEIIIKQTKTYFERTVPISKKVREELDKYLIVRGRTSTNRLFVNIDGGPLLKRGIQSRIEHYGRLAGITNVRCSAHTFRHTFARHFIVNGADAFSLMKILGHTNMEITKRYVNLWGSDLQTSHQKYSPLNNMK